MIRVIAFTKKGIELGDRLIKSMNEDITGYYKTSRENTNELKKSLLNSTKSVEEIVKDAFSKRDPIVFIGAAGIAVRYIAPYVKDKMEDSPVLVIDDNGIHVIPILSGHVGGANKLAYEIAEAIDAIPVITTSTDVNSAFSVDTFACENNLKIVNRENVKNVSGKAIEGKPIVLSIKNYPYDDADVIISDEEMPIETFKTGVQLISKKYVVGIGLKKNKEFEKVEEHLLKVLNDNQIDIKDVYAIASIDLKIEEDALEKISKKYRIPRLFFDADLLNKVKGEFSSSAFVKETVGVDNVCERAAVLGAGIRSSLVVSKNAYDGITVAVAKRNI